MSMSVKRLAKYCGLSERSIQRATLREDIPYHQIRRRMFFELDEVLAETKEEHPPISPSYPNIRL